MVNMPWSIAHKVECSWIVEAGILGVSDHKRHHLGAQITATNYMPGRVVSSVAFHVQLNLNCQL